MLISRPAHPYLKTIFEISDKYFSKVFTPEELAEFREYCFRYGLTDRDEAIAQYIRIYYNFVKKKRQAEYTDADKPFNTTLFSYPLQPKIVWGDNLMSLKRMDNESIQLIVTSPPYYNARDYSHYNDLDEYLNKMKAVIKECYRVLDNHRAFVLNVGDIYDNDNITTKSSWGKRRIPLAAHFINIFEVVGYHFVDNFIWDKGEVQSQRHKNQPYPLYQYPLNCYEHILVFFKHEVDPTPYPCPVCGCLKVNGNAYSSIGVKSWECKNEQCFHRSKSNRGKRFSARTQVMNRLKTDKNILDEDVLDKWRRDIVKLTPVIKINSKGENTHGHPAPFPSEIPEYAIKAFTGENEHVLDPFAGSFTTVIEAVKHNRRGIGMEINKTLFRDAILKHITENLDVKPMEL